MSGERVGVCLFDSAVAERDDGPHATAGARNVFARTLAELGVEPGDEIMLRRRDRDRPVPSRTITDTSSYMLLAEALMRWALDEGVELGDELVITRPPRRRRSRSSSPARSRRRWRSNGGTIPATWEMVTACRLLGPGGRPRGRFGVEPTVPDLAAWLAGSDVRAGDIVLLAIVDRLVNEPGWQAPELVVADPTPDALAALLLAWAGEHGAKADDALFIFHDGGGASDQTGSGADGGAAS